MPIFTNQSLLTIVAKMYYDVSAATVKKILWQQPNGGLKGEWIATRLVGIDQLEYDIQSGDLPLKKGIYQFQGYVEIGGKAGPGDIFKFEFIDPLQ